MGATTVGALIGAAIDEMNGGDDVAEGAVFGAITANVLKVVLPLAVTYAIGWGVLRGVAEIREKVLGGPSV